MLNRRQFLRNAGAASLLLAGGSLRAREYAPRPNILLLMTDQSRVPVWYPPGYASIMPARTRLAQQGVSFNDFYVSSIPCSPNRACILTGLHAHQHWIVDNVQVEDTLQLDPAFPNFASALAQRGYRTFYFGKWHLTNRQLWRGVTPEAALQPYGFDVWRPQNGPNTVDYEGLPNEGYEEDATITDAVVQWMQSSDVTQPPWLAVASLVNPHDSAWYPNYTAQLIAQLKETGEWTDYGVQLPRNYESLSRLSQNKPACQAEQAISWAETVGAIRYVDGTRSWTELLNYYLFLEASVDAQVARIIAALDARPQVRANTAVIYASDHGENVGSHGLQEKMSAAYEEQNHIPCIFVDHTGRFMPPTQAGTTRAGFASSIDLMPSVLELAGVPTDDYPYLPGTSLVPSLASPDVPLAPFLLASTDFFLGPEAPSRALHYHDARWKITVYNDWIEGTTTPDPEREEAELYDLQASGGRLELQNVAGTAPEFPQLRDNLVDLYANAILAAPLPAPLDAVQAAARQHYLDTHAPDAGGSRGQR
jgi:arylsulfatase A-like enzyme